MDKDEIFSCSSMKFIAHFYDGKWPEPIPNDELFELIKDAQFGNFSAQNKIVESMFRFIYKIARSNNRPGSDIDDLFQVGVIGCVKAIQTFKVDYDYKFTTYAGTVISNEIRMYLRSLKLKYKILSIDEPIYQNSEGDDIYLLDILEDTTLEHSPDRYVEAIMMQDLVLSELNKLSERDKVMIEYRFGLNGRMKMSQRKIGNLYGFSQSYVSKIINAALKNIRENIGYMLH